MEELFRLHIFSLYKVWLYIFVNWISAAVCLNIINIKTTSMEQDFTVLENKIVGRNMYKFRKIRDVKASDMADYVGISESAYTKYERGESKITVDIVQKVAEYLKVDPLNIISSTPGNFIENGNYSPNAGVGNYVGGDIRLADENQTALITKLIETQIAINEKVLALLEKK